MGTTPGAEALGLPVAVLAAVISAAVAVVLAVVAQFETWRRERAARAYERRRTALIDCQDAALDVRRELRLYGAALRTAVTDAPSPGSLVVDVDDAGVAGARGRLEVCRTRLERRPLSQAAASALLAWESAATERFLSPDDVTAGAEQAAWEEFLDAVADALA